jgi:predicted Zn-dependent protease
LETSAFELQHRDAAQPTITYDALVLALISGRGEQAIRELRTVAAVNPRHALLQEERLWRLQLSLVASWGLSEQAMPLIEYAAELYPESRRALATFAEACVRLEDYPQALVVLDRYLKRYPDDKGAQAMLEQAKTAAVNRGK